MIQYAIYVSPGGALVADYSNRVQGLAFATNNRGFAECTGFVPMSLQEAFQLYDRAGLPHVLVNDASSGQVFEGRLEDVAITKGGVNLTALGYSRSLGDSPYTALWSLTDVRQFRPTRPDEQASRSPEQYQIDTNNRIQIALPQGQIYGNVANTCGMVYQIPDGSSRQIIGVAFDAVVTLPTNWIVQLNQWSANYAGVTTALIDTGIAGTNVINKFFTFAGCSYLEFVVYNNTGANYTVNNAPNVWRVQITNVRVVTTTANKVDTTTTAVIAAGAAVSVPVVSSTRMYVGQRLHMGIPAAIGFNATVLTIPDATHFTADLSAAMASGGNVQAFVVYADEIVKDLVSVTATLNSTQLASSTALIQSPALDLLNESYEDQYGADILDYLIKLGDNQTTPRQWEWGVLTGRLLYFRPQSSAARTWYIDISELDVQRTIDALYNSIYATYQEAGGRALRTNINADSGSVARYGLTRRKVRAVQSTSLTQANAQRDAVLADSSDPKPKSGVAITKLYDASGSLWALTSAHAGDTVIIRNLPPTLSTAIDRIRVFRLTRTEYHADDDTLTLEPEAPLSTLESQLALAVPPAWVTAPWWVQVGQK